MRNWLEQQKRENQLLWVVIIVTVVFVAVVIPLYVIALYSYPTSDDFAYADSIYQNLIRGARWQEIIRGAWAEGLRYYRDWQGRYFDDMVSAFGVGIAVPELYFIGAFVVLTIFITSGILFIRMILHRICGWDQKIVWIISMYLIIMQLLYVPYAAEGFYWYVGATGYTGTYALLLFLLVAIAGFYKAKGIYGRIASGTIAAILTAFVGGSNYATGLLTLEVLVCCVVLLYYHRHRGLFVLCILMEYMACFALNAFSHGNTNRMNNVDGLPPMQSILASLQRGAIFCKEWFHIPVFIMLVVIVLLSMRSLANMKYTFGFPGLVTLVGFGLFSSILTPPFFASATWGPGRLINILYYVYYVMLIVNVLYWTGWVLHHFAGASERVLQSKIEQRFGLCIMIAALIGQVGCLKLYGLQSTSATSAALSIVKGEATQYKAENEERWQLYEDSSVSDVEVSDFSVKPYVLYHDDITTDETDWRNTTTANFFGKDTVKIVGEFKE